MSAIRRLPILLSLLALATGLAGTGRSLAQQQLNAPATGAIFASAADGHLYRSGDGGRTWSRSDQGLPGAVSIAAAHDHGTTVYAGTDGSGVYVSADGGNTWQPANGKDGPANASIVALAVDPHDPRHVVAADDQYFFYSSADGGRTWLATSLPNVEPHGDYSWEAPSSVTMDAQQPNNVLLGTGAGVFSTNDGGANLDIGSLEQESVNMVASDPNSSAIYAATEYRLYKSQDHGLHWTVLKGGLPLDTSFRIIAVDPRDGHHLIAAVGDNGLYHSADGGMTWKASIAHTTGKVTAVVFDPTKRLNVLAGFDDGHVLSSADLGASWSPGTTQFTSAQFTGNQFVSSVIVTMAGGPSVPYPTDQVPPPAAGAGLRYFAATGHAIRGPFLTFWNQHGNVSILGLPLTEAFVNGNLTLQYFERAELAIVGGHVTVGPLGTLITSGRQFKAVAPFTSSATRQYFPDTGHALAAPFLAYWQAHQGAAVFGPPISEPLREQNGDGSGRAYLVQYCKNARLEYHPELAGTRYQIQVGLLGRQYVQQLGWL